MKIKLFIPLFLSMLFLACGEEVIKKPENLIPKDKMVDILHDLAVLKAAENNIEPILEYKETNIMELIYNKYEIDSVQLAKSDLYYASIPLEYQGIYEKIDARLERRKDAMEGRTKKRNDSVRSSRKKKRDSIKTPKKV